MRPFRVVPDAGQNGFRQGGGADFPRAVSCVLVVIVEKRPFPVHDENGIERLAVEHAAGHVPPPDALFHQGFLAGGEEGVEGCFEFRPGVHAAEQQAGSSRIGLDEQGVRQAEVFRIPVRPRMAGQENASGQGNARFPEQEFGRRFVQGQEGTGRVRALIGTARLVEQGLEQSVLARRTVHVDERHVMGACGAQHLVKIPARVKHGDAVPLALQGFSDHGRAAQGDFTLA